MILRSLHAQGFLLQHHLYKYMWSASSLFHDHKVIANILKRNSDRKQADNHTRRKIIPVTEAKLSLFHSGKRRAEI